MGVNLLSIAVSKLEEPPEVSLHLASFLITQDFQGPCRLQMQESLTITEIHDTCVNAYAPLTKGLRTCLTAILKRGGTLKSISTAAKRSSLPFLPEAAVLAVASHLAVRLCCLHLLLCCADMHRPELKACDTCMTCV